MLGECRRRLPIPYLCGIPARFRGRSGLMMIKNTAFVDETEGGDVFLMAAWVSDVDTWEAFTEAWQDTLDSAPTIKYFKHSEAMAAIENFAHWERPAIDDKMSRLVDVICAHEMSGLVAGARVSTYTEAFRSDILGEKQVKSVLKLTHPYHTCFFSIPKGIIQFQKERGVDAKVDFVFDRQDGMFLECKILFEEMMKILPEEILRNIGTIIDQSDEDVLPLQAADLLAGQMRQEIISGHRDKHVERMRIAHDIGNTAAYPPWFKEIPEMKAAIERVIPWLTQYRKLAKIYGWDDLKD